VLAWINREASGSRPRNAWGARCGRPPAAAPAPRAQFAGQAAALRRPGDYPNPCPCSARPWSPSMTLGSRLRNSRIRSPAGSGHDACQRESIRVPGTPRQGELDERAGNDNCDTPRLGGWRRPSAAGLRAGPSLGARAGPQRPGLPRRPGGAEPLLGHRRHLPGGLRPGHRQVHRGARGGRRVHPQHHLLGHGVHPPRPRRRLPGLPLARTPAPPARASNPRPTQRRQGAAV
jgi:hypothetical protein